VDHKLRKLIAFDSEGERLVGTLDLPDGTASTGVLIVSGGNEVRSGAHRGMAMLAQELAHEGLAVFRFDRAGVGDSTGANRGYEESREDIRAAGAVLGRVAGVELIVGFGNCDGATALALFGRECGLDAVVLGNPWLGDEGDGLPPPAAIRAHYRQRLGSPRAWLRLAIGGVSLGKLVGGLAKIAQPAPRRDLAVRVLDGVDDWTADAAIVLAKRDATGIAFAAAAGLRQFQTYEADTASHSFEGEAAREQLTRVITQQAARLVASYDAGRALREQRAVTGVNPVTSKLG
jgi:exosortase A-associated hydrolase 1